MNSSFYLLFVIVVFIEYNKVDLCITRIKRVYECYLINGICADWPAFHLYTKSNPNNFANVTTSNLEAFGFSYKKETKVLIHGLSSSGTRTLLLQVKDEILKKEDVNVIVVDWESGAAIPFYFQAVSNSVKTGKKVGEFLDVAEINPITVHCIGHSLGAHACGFVGKYRKLKRISGLDPASIGFKDSQPYDRLDKTDAHFVDVIHTDDLFGLQESIGHQDFWPNGGHVQTGCVFKKTQQVLNSVNTTEDYGVIGKTNHNVFSNKSSKYFTKLISCSHTISQLFYAQSISASCQFKSAFCNNPDDFFAQKCSCASSVCTIMGYYATNNIQGNFYLSTVAEPPYCQTT